MTAPSRAEPVPDPEDERTLPKPRGRQVLLGDLTQLVAHPLGEVGLWTVLLVAAFVDTATFHQVLLLVMTSATTGVAWGIALGFVAIALALAHYVGSRAKLSLTPSSATTTTIGAGTIAWICFGIWSALGLVSFLTRLLIDDAGHGGGTAIVVDGQLVDVGAGDATLTRVLSALMFLGLYVATGALSALAGSSRQTAARRWRPVKRQQKRVQCRYTVLHADMVYGLQLLDAIGQERKRRDIDLASALRRCDAMTAGLKQEVRLMLRRHGGDARPQPEFGTDGT